MKIEATEQAELDKGKPEPEALSLWVANSIKRIAAGKRERAETVKGTPGLQLISRTNGSRSWKWFYWNPDTNKTDSITFGPAKLNREIGENPIVGEPMTIGMAKELAAYGKRLVREKRDPKPILTKLKRDVERLMSATLAGHKVDDLFREYLTNYNYKAYKARRSTVEYYGARLGLKPDGQDGWEPTGNGVLSKWQGKIYATHSGEVKISHVEADAILRQMAPAVADKTLEGLKRFGDWAVYYEKASRNPFAIMGKLHEHTERQRRLTDEEIKLLWQLSETTNDERTRLYGASAQLMLLTVCRAGAARRAKWSDFDLEKAIWYLPATERNKRQKKAIGRHPIPLSSAALALLAKLPHKGDYVFSQDGKSPIPEDAKADTRTFRKHMEKALGRSYATEPEATEDDPFTGDWEWRDMRRTAATALQGVKVDGWSIPPHVIKAIQDHAQDKVSAAYLKGKYVEEARTALEAWGHKLAEITK